jgi:type VI secretion system protein ImpM
MRSGLYGKLAQKRDYIAVSTPRGFLETVEPWLQASLHASRHALGASWQPLYLRSPIWRFWIGADIVGEPTIGCLMPSLDGVGRYFPLVLLCPSDPGRPLPPPAIDAQDGFMAEGERFLLSTLDERRSFDGLMQELTELPSPDMAHPEAPPGLESRVDGTLELPLAGSAGTIFRALATADHARLFARMSFWWTMGGQGFEPAALSVRGLPQASLYLRMLGSGR